MTPVLVVCCSFVALAIVMIAATWTRSALVLIAALLLIVVTGALQLRQKASSASKDF